MNYTKTGGQEKRKLLNQSAKRPLIVAYLLWMFFPGFAKHKKVGMSAREESRVNQMIRHVFLAVFRGDGGRKEDSRIKESELKDTLKKSLT